MWEDYRKKKRYTEPQIRPQCRPASMTPVNAAYPEVEMNSNLHHLDDILIVTGLYLRDRE